MVRVKRDRRRKNDRTAPFGAFALTVAIAAACGGKSVVVSDDAAAGDGDTGGHGGSVTGGKGGKGGKGGQGGTGGDAGSESVGGTGGGGGSVVFDGGSGGRGGSSGRGGTGNVAGVGAAPSAGRGGSAGFGGVGISGRGPGGAPTAGFAGFAGFAGAPLAGFGGLSNGCDACVDDDVCTDDICTETGVCVFRLNAANCDDGDACTANDHCSIGSCLPGNPVSCEDNEACTIDSCDSELGCGHTPLGFAADETDRNIPESEIDCSPAPTSAVSVVTLADPGNVGWLTAEVELEHPWAGDLTIELEHGGVSVKLFARFPGDGSLSSNFGGTYTFADTGRAFELLGDVGIPSDTYASLESLAGFEGLPASGDWKLTVSDACHTDKGTLRGWRLHVGSTCTGASSCAGVCDAGVCLCGG